MPVGQQQMFPQQNMQGMQQQQQQPQQQQQQQPGKQVIWEGELQWKENTKAGDASSSGDKTEHVVMCSVTSSKENGGQEVKSENWPRRLIMQLIPKSLVQTIGSSYFKSSRSVLFHPEPSEALNALTKVLSNGFAGCVHFAGAQNCDIKVQKKEIATD